MVNHSFLHRCEISLVYKQDFKPIDMAVVGKTIDLDTNLEPAILFFKTQAKLAHAMKLDPQAVTQWKRRGIPPARAKEISDLTGGAVKPWEIKPKFFSGCVAP